MNKALEFTDLSGQLLPDPRGHDIYIEIFKRLQIHVGQSIE